MTNPTKIMISSCRQSTTCPNQNFSTNHKKQQEEINYMIDSLQQY